MGGVTTYRRRGHTRAVSPATNASVLADRFAELALKEDRVEVDLGGSIGRVRVRQVHLDSMYQQDLQVIHLGGEAREGPLEIPAVLVARGRVDRLDAAEGHRRHRHSLCRGHKKGACDGSESKGRAHGVRMVVVVEVAV